MKILVTGNMGYIGPTVVRHLRAAHPGARIDGLDMGYFAHCLTAADVLPECWVDCQYFGDVRRVADEFLDGYDAVVQLAAISNDPMGKTYEAVTLAVNQHAAVDIAKKAKRAGVRNYVFASSCSVYGAAEGGPRSEVAPLNPLTAYARSKIGTEQALQSLAAQDFVITCLRFATACGMSERLRLDLVLNDFVAGAVTSGTISILSDGTPWRPLIHVDDMARAIEWAVTRAGETGGDFLSVNVGSDTWNYQVLDLAQAVAEAIPGVRISLNKDAPPDKRSYQVDFSKFRALAPGHQPQVTLQQAVQGLVEGLRKMAFADANFRESSLIRLKVLAAHRMAGRLNADLEWQGRGI
jgi:nucleoside-diphosphate-sugar epimerase